MTERVDDAVLAELQRQCYTNSDRYKIATELIERRRAEKAAVPLAWMRPRKDGYDSAFRDAAVVEACTGNSWDGWIPLYAHAAPPAGMDIPTIMSEVGKLVDAAAIYDPIGYDNGETAAQMAKIRVMLAAAEQGAK